MLLALGAAAPLPAVAAAAQVTFEVPQGKTKSMRLRNVASGMVMSIALRTSGRLLVALVGAHELKASPKNPRTLFRGAVERAMSFQVSIPKTGDYYLVLNNKRGSEPLEVRVTIRAERAKKPATPPADGDKARDGDLLRSSGEGEQIAEAIVDAQQLAARRGVMALSASLRQAD